MKTPGQTNGYRLRPLRLALRLLAVILAAASIAGCANVEIAPPHKAPIPTEARMLLGKKKMTESAPIFIRIFKAESELEIWKQRGDGHFHHFKTYPICHWSGDLGPKLRQGDKQAPEGFYTVNRHQMNPNSKFHLSFDLGYPNAFDRAHDRTGDFLMVHGKCRSAGCYAMTDGLMEEIYAIVREAFAGGQQKFHVHAFPFRMTEQNMARYRGNKNIRFWRSLKRGYDYFEITRQVPTVEICRRQYHVNVERVSYRTARLDPRGACPRFRPGPVVAFSTNGRNGNSAAVQPPRPVPVSAQRNGTTPPVRYHASESQRRPMSLSPAITAPQPRPLRRDPIGELIRN